MKLTHHPIRYRYFLLILATYAATVATTFIHPNIASAVSGSDWRAGQIIDDGIFYNSSDMSVTDVQNFLNAKVPTCDTWGTQTSEYGGGTRAQYGAAHGHPAPYVCLKDYYENPSTHANNLNGNPIPSGSMSAAQIIKNAADTYNISVRVLLATLQKESGGPLITDTWPYSTQYTNAMGYGCPDTAACDAQYAGFYNQVTNAARQFNLYKNYPGNYRYKPQQNNTILYNPSSSCGSSSVFLKTTATAGLYNYTPYQPDAAALANMYGSGDSCSAYGNRNFWRIFNDWFGSTLGSVSLIKSSSDPTVYVLYGGKKQGIPSQDVLNAWGLENLPINTMDDASVSAIPTRGPLTRVAKNPYNSALYLFADNGGTYDSLSNMISDWGYDPNAASDIGNELIAFTTRLGGLSNFVTSPTAGAIYMVDNGTFRAFSTSDNFQSWAGSSNVNVISNNLLALLPTGAGILSDQAQTGTTQYLASGGKLLTIPSEMSGLYPRSSVMTISNALSNVLPGGAVSKFVKGTAGTIYLMDSGMKHGIASLGLLVSYAPAGQISVTNLSDAAIAQIPSGQPVTTRFAYNTTDNSKQYYINNSYYSAPSATFQTQTYGFGISAAGLSLVGPQNVPISCPQGLVQAAGSPGIAILDGGVRRGIGSINMLDQINNRTGNVCILNPEDVNAMPNGSPISPFVSNGGVNYILDQANRYSASVSVAGSLGVSSFTPVTSAFLSSYSDQGAMASSFKVGNTYVFTNSGRYFTTENQNIAALWGISSANQNHSDYLLGSIPTGGQLIPFARPTDPSVGAIYIVDDGKFLPISSLDHLFNAGFGMQTIPAVSLSYINANLGATWQGYLAKDATTNALYVLEGGKKHPIPTDLVGQWVGTTSPITPTTLSTDFLGLLATGPSVTKSLETGAPGIYAMVDGQKSGIPNLKTYASLYAPDIVVSPQLVNSIPLGPPVPSL